MELYDKYWSVTMSDEVYTSLTYETRESFKSEKVYYDDWDRWKEDDAFRQLYTKYKKAKKALDDYKYLKRDRDV